MVALVDGPYCHVEIAFVDGISSSVFAGEIVFMHHRTFANPNYTLVPIQATEEQVMLARAFCEEQVRMKVPFDGWGMYMSWLPSILPSLQNEKKTKSNTGTFCSKHVVLALQHAGVEGFENMQADKTTPSGLYRKIQSLYAGCTVMTSTAFRLKQLCNRY